MISPIHFPAQVDNSLDDTNEGLLKASFKIEEAEKQQLISEDDVKALQRRIILLDDDLTIVEQRLGVETKKLEEVSLWWGLLWLLLWFLLLSL